MEILIIRLPDELLTEGYVNNLQDNLVYLGINALIFPKSVDIMKVASLYTKEDIDAMEEDLDIEKCIGDDNFEEEYEDNTFVSFFQTLEEDRDATLNRFTIKNCNE